MSIRIANASTDPQLRDLGALLLAYADEHGWANEPYHLDEIAGLPGEYAPPKGAALVAYEDETPVGCLVVRSATRWVSGAAELRRLYVIPTARGKGIARALVLAAERSAKKSGYSSLVLVSLEAMTAAQSLYGSLGFRFVEPYRESLADDVVFMAKELER